MDHAQLQDLGVRFRQQRDRNRVVREREERLHGFGLLVFGVFGAVVVVAVLIYAFA